MTWMRARPTAAGIDPDRVKFTRTLRIIRRAVSPAFPPDHTAALRAQITADITRALRFGDPRGFQVRSTARH